MNIAFISQHFHPEQFSNNVMAAYLAASGHKVDVLTAVPNYPAGKFFPGYSNRKNRRETWENVSIHRIFTVPRGSRALRLIVNYLAFAICGMWSALFGRRPVPDVIFVSQLSPVLMCLPGIIMKWRYRTPLVIWVQDIWPESAIYTLGLKNPFVVKPLNWLCGWIYRRADLVLVQSAAFPPMIERFGIPGSKIEVLPNTAPDTFRPVAADPASEIGQMMPETGFNLMFAGNIGESQDFDTYLATAERLAHRAELNWIIIGTGRDMARVQAEVCARGLEDRFRFLGRYPEGAMPAFFAHADAMLVSLKDNAIFRLTIPYKIQCYMAAGKPVIASLNGEGARVIAEAGAGLTAPAETPEQLAETIEQMMDSDSREAMANAGRQYFEENFSRGAVYGKLLEFLVSVQR